MRERSWSKKLLGVLLTIVMCLTVCISMPMSVKAETVYDVYVTGTYGQSTARTMLSMINNFRGSSDAWYWNSDNTTKTYCSNLQSLKYDYELEKIAMQRAMEIAIYWDHMRPSGQDTWSAYTGYFNYGWKGENIAAGYSSTESVFIGWREDDKMYSGQGHRRNMLSSNFQYIGIGHVVYNGTHFWVQEFSSVTSGIGMTTANDSQTTVKMGLLDSFVYSPNLTMSTTPITVDIGANVDLPLMTGSVSVTGGWPSSTKNLSVVPIWTSSNSGVARVENGKVYGVGRGTATLTANAFGLTKTINVTVNGPAVPANVVLKSAVASSNSITVSWNAASGATSYDVYRKSAGVAYKKIGTTTSTSFTDTKAVGGVNYAYTVRAVNAIGRSEGYDKAGVVAKITALPGKVTINEVKAGKTCIGIKWNAVPTAASYMVYRKTAGGSWTVIATDVTSLNYLDLDAVGGVSYTYTVRAYNNNGKGAYDTVGKSAVITYTPPKVVLDDATWTNRGIKVTWEKTLIAEGYYVYRKTGTGNWIRIAKVTDTTSFIDTNYVNGTTNTYTVRAYNKNGMSASYDKIGVSIVVIP